MKRIIYPLLAVALIGFAALGVNRMVTHTNTLQLREVQLKDTSADLKELKLKYDNLNYKLDHTDKTKTQEIQRLENEKNQLEQERQRLEGELQAKLERKRLEAERQQNLVARATGTAVASAAPVGGSCAEWKAAAGIPETYATQALIDKESGCRPNAVNPSSGACGIPQALPCSKMGCSLDAAGAVCQLRWMDNYVHNRYGSWENAYATWQSRCGSPQGCWY